MPSFHRHRNNLEKKNTIFSFFFFLSEDCSLKDRKTGYLQLAFMSLVIVTHAAQDGKYLYSGILII